MAPYLITLAVGDYDLTEREVDGITYRDAVLHRADRPAGRQRPGRAGAPAGDRRVPGRVYGSPYPFTECGGIVNRLLAGLRPGDPDPPDLRPRLLRHGGRRRAGRGARAGPPVDRDDLRLDRWSDIWLNEGFATYAEWADRGAGRGDRRRPAGRRPRPAGRRPVLSRPSATPARRPTSCSAARCTSGGGHPGRAARRGRRRRVRRAALALDHRPGPAGGDHRGVHRPRRRGGRHRPDGVLRRVAGRGQAGLTRTLGGCTPTSPR